MAGYIDATHNMLFKLDPARWNQDLNVSGKGDLIGYQECRPTQMRDVLKAWCVKQDRGIHHPDGSGNPITWRRAMFERYGPNPTGFGGRVLVHLGAKQMGITDPGFLPPSKDYTYIGLRHKASGKTVLRINVHPVASATDPTPEEGPRLSQWMNWAIQQYWLDVLAFTAKEMSRMKPVKNSMVRYWDVISMGGDYNGDLTQTKDDRWYYPSRMLPALYAADGRQGGLDHLQLAHGSDAVVAGRWTAKGHTDHLIQFVTRTFRAVDDTPGA